MERAVPLTCSMAELRSKLLRSGILILAISSTCFSVILPTRFLFGSADPLARFTARLISTGTGGVLVMNVNERSEKIVITTGMISPSWSFADVFALNALQNSMMLTPCGPSAVPTGGAGVALPAGICNFTIACTFFAITLTHEGHEGCRRARRRTESVSLRVLRSRRALRGSNLLHLQKVQFHRRGAAEDRHHHLQ